MKRRPICSICLLLLGWLLFCSVFLPKEEEENPLEGKNVLLRAEVVRTEQKEQSKALYLKEIYLYNNSEHKNSQYEILKENNKDWKSLDNHAIAYTKEEKEFLPGDLLYLKGRVGSFDEARNPGQFDAKSYYKIRNIEWMLQDAKVVAWEKGGFSFAGVLHLLKERCKGIFQEIAPEEAGILEAMLLGDKTQLQVDIKSLYQRNGISHILAVSGLHISMIGMGIYQGLKKCRLSFYKILALSAGTMLLYGSICGWGISTQRAVTMFLFYLGAKAFGRKYDPMTALAFSAVAILLREPGYLMDAGFQLSFGAVLGILVVAPQMQKIVGKEEAEGYLGKGLYYVKTALLSSLGLQLAILPITMWFFYQVPLYGMLLNLLVIPLAQIVVGAGIAGGIGGSLFLPIGQFVVAPAVYVLRLYENLCLMAERLPMANLITGRPAIGSILLYYVILLGLLLFAERTVKGRRLKWGLGSICMLAILFLRIRTELVITVMDVGQGDGICIESKSGATYLIDGGSSDVKNLMSARIEPFLKSRGIGTLDYLILTHMDQDHISGGRELLGQETDIRVKNLILPKLAEKDETYMEIEELAKKNNIPVIYFQKGDKILDRGVSFQCLHPFGGGSGLESNESSLVLEVSYGDFNGLLTGDLEEEGEKQVCEQNLSRMDFLKVGHHGSKGATAEALLDKIKPSLSLISCGRKNSYGHPHKEVLERLKRSKSKVLITKEVGAIQIISNGSTFYCKSMIE